MTLFKSLKKTVSLVIVLVLLLSTMVTNSGAAQASPDDLQGHWAESQMRQWVEQGLLRGDNGSYYPNRSITRAEFITLINRALKLSEPADINFTDLTASHWAYDQAAIAVKAGYLTGFDDKTIRLNQNVTREESAVMVAKLLKLATTDLAGLAKFKDAASISSWSKRAILALVNASILLGNSKGNIVPQGMLSRAEAVTLLSKAVDNMNLQANPNPTDLVYSVAGVYGPMTGIEILKGNVTVAASGVTLQNIVIEGNLTLTKAVGEGDAFFKKVTVRGTTTIQGGGSGSVHFDDSILVRISVEKQSGIVRVVAAGATSVQNVVVHSPVKLEEVNVTGSGFSHVELAKDVPAGSQVQLIGQFEDVSILCSDSKVAIPSGSVKQLTVETGAANTEISIHEKASIIKLVLHATAKILGEGTIAKANLNSEAIGSTFETRPIIVEDESSTPAMPPVAPPITGGGGGPGGSNPSPQPNPEPNPIPCKGTAAECSDTKLVDLRLSGFTMNQLDPMDYYTTGEKGFNSNVGLYSVVTKREMPKSVTTTVSVTKSKSSRVEYVIFGTGYVELKSGILTNINNSFQIEINPMEDMIFNIFVDSGDSKESELYQIHIQYSRTLQEAFKVDSRISEYWQDGQVVSQEKSYYLRGGSLQGDKIRDTDTKLLFEKNEATPFLTCSSFDTCKLPDEKISNGVGVWYVEVYREGILLASGDYTYDFNISPVGTRDIGLKAAAYTKKELTDALANTPTQKEPNKYGYRLVVDTKRILELHPGAKYLIEGSKNMIGSTTSYSQGLLAEELKVGVDPFSYLGYPFSDLIPIVATPSGKQTIFDAMYTGYSWESIRINDQFIHLGLYDENFKLIGQYMTVLTFDQDHVGDGYIAVQNWKPAH